MSRRTRYFLIGSALIVIVGLGTGLVARYGSVLPLRSSTVGPAELAYVPPDVTAVAYADVRQIMGSAFLQQLRQNLPTGAAKDELLAATGVDLDHDIDSVVAGLNVGKAGNNPPVGLLRGRFNDAQIEALAVQHGASVETYRDKRMLILHHNVGPAAPAPGGLVMPSGVSDDGAVAFLEPGLIACGDAAGVKRAIDAAATRMDVTKNADLMKFIGEVENTGNAWVVGRFDVIAANANLPDQIKTELPSLDSFTVSAQFDAGVSGRVHVEARDEKAGEQLRAVVNGALAAARLMTSQNPRADAALSALQTSGAGTSVEVSFSLPPDILQTMGGMAAMVHGAAGAGAGVARPR